MTGKTEKAGANEVPAFSVMSQPFPQFSKLTPLYSRDKIAARVHAMAHALSQTFAGREPLVIGVLKGAFLFVADLVRAMEIPVKIDFVQAASYGSATISSEHVRLVKDCTMDISGQDVILVDTIVDTGLTLDFLHTHLRLRHPRSLTTCALLDKPRSRQVEVYLDHVGFTLGQGFVVGYGLDFEDAYRHIDGLYLVDEV